MKTLDVLQSLSPATQAVLAAYIAFLVYIASTALIAILRTILGGVSSALSFFARLVPARREPLARSKHSKPPQSAQKQKRRGVKIQAPADSSASEATSSAYAMPAQPPPPGISLKSLIKSAGKGKAIHGAGADRHADSDLFITTLRGHGDAVTGLAFSVDGGALATACEDRELRVFSLPRDDIYTSKAIPFRNYSLRLGVQDVAFGASSASLAVLARGAANAPELCFVDVSGREPEIQSKIETLFQSRNVMGLCLRGSVTSAAAGGPPVVVAASEGPELRLFTASPGLPVLGKIDTGGMRTYRAAVSEEGRFVAAATFTSDVKIYEVSFDRAGGFAGLAKAMDLKGHRKKVTCVAFSPDSTRAVTASEDGTLRIWNINVRYKQQEDPKNIATTGVPEPKQMVSRLAWGPGGHIAASCGGNLYFLDSRSGEVVDSVLGAHSRAVTDVAWAPGRYGGPQGAVMMVATAGEDGRVRLWRAPWPVA